MKRIALIAALLAFAVEVTPANAAGRGFTADFTNCSEFAGWGPVANTPLATALVPANFTTLLESGQATIVIRASSCEGVSVNGSKPVPTTLSHIGIGVVSPDGSGTINNYTLVYLTNNLQLAQSFQWAGMPAIFDPMLDYEYSGDAATAGSLYVGASAPSLPPYFLAGAEQAATGPQLFIANWWFQGREGIIKQQTTFPAIAFGAADVTFHTSSSSLVGKLIGGNSDANFPYFNARGAYSTAQMVVTVE
ncbi:MAG: hypothetical protein ABSF28_12070 [Terracidiphilus sp.]|jgi:hypothetical protein